MYEQATVLDYEGKKIWIKHIEDDFYCVNGRYIGFSSKQDLNKSVVIATALDEFYGPLHGGEVNNDSIITFSVLPNGHLITSHYHLSDTEWDKVLVDSIRCEYDEWYECMSPSDVYIDERLDMNLIEWLDEQDTKYERAGI